MRYKGSGCVSCYSRGQYTGMKSAGGVFEFSVSTVCHECLCLSIGLPETVSNLTQESIIRNALLLL
jgi:hypothetical protein